MGWVLCVRVRESCVIGAQEEEEKEEDHPGSQKETPAALLRIIIPSVQFVLLLFFLVSDDNGSGQHNVLIPSTSPNLPLVLYLGIYLHLVDFNSSNILRLFLFIFSFLYEKIKEELSIHT